MISAIFTYCMVWWVVLYLTLPFGNKPPKILESGHANSAPEKPRVWLKILITSVLSLPLTYLAIKLIAHFHLNHL